jgi:hypothetical protein
MNVLVAFTRPLNNAGTLMVFESAGDFAANNADKTRELFLADLSGTAPTFKQITNQTTADVNKSDFSFLPSINGAGTFVSLGSVLNLAPTETHSCKRTTMMGAASSSSTTSLAQHPRFQSSVS